MLAKGDGEGEVVDDEVTMVRALKALAHPVRLGMVRKLAVAGEICACDFTDDFDISQPTVSAHLRTLREAGLVTTRRDGTTICYSVVPGTLAKLGGELTGIDDTITVPRLPQLAGRRCGRRVCAHCAKRGVTAAGDDRLGCVVTGRPGRCPGRSVSVLRR